MPGLLSPQRGGLLGSGPIRQMSVPQSGPTGPGWLAMGQDGGYGSDAWALQGGGPGALLWRQILRGMAGSKNPLNILDPGKATEFFTPETIGYLAPRYQDAFAKKGKT